MKGSRLIFLVILSAGLSAGLTSWLAKNWHQDPSPKSPQIPHSQNDQDFHRWLHANLELTPAQEKALRPAEARFEDEHSRLLQELQATSTSLAHALSDSGKGPAERPPLMEKRHQLQGQIQRLIIAHLLEKRAQLTLKQKKRYRHWIHQSIDHDHGE